MTTTLKASAAKILKIFLCIIGTVAVLSALLFFASLVPKPPLYENLKIASLHGDFDNSYPKVLFQSRTIDLYTECVGIGIAAALTPTTDSLIWMGNYGECPGLKQAIERNFPEYAGSHYARYVHGYQIFLKPLYTFFTRDLVTVLTAVCTLAFLCIFFAAANKRLGTVYAVALLASFAFIRSAHIFTLVTHAVQFWVVMGGCIAVLLNRNPQLSIYIFAITGATDAYMTFLSMGSLSLGMPLLCLCLASWVAGEKPGQTLLLAFYCCLAWSTGFLSVWLIKWGLALWHLPEGSTLLGQTVDKYSARDIAMIGKAISNNVNRTARWLWISIYIVLGIRLLFVGKAPPKGSWVLLFPALIPFVWMCLLPGQSGVAHSSFVYIILWPSLAAILLFLLAYPAGKHTADAPEHRANIKG